MQQNDSLSSVLQRTGAGEIGAMLQLTVAGYISARHERCLRKRRASPGLRVRGAWVFIRGSSDASLTALVQMRPT